jgi:hypothetical protein
MAAKEAAAGSDAAKAGRRAEARAAEAPSRGAQYRHGDGNVVPMADIKYGRGRSRQGCGRLSASGAAASATAAAVTQSGGDGGGGNGGHCDFAGCVDVNSGRCGAVATVRIAAAVAAAGDVA